jgi:tetratricopeptide (TPR) repeat protein
MKKTPPTILKAITDWSALVLWAAMVLFALFALITNIQRLPHGIGFMVVLVGGCIIIALGFFFRYLWRRHGGRRSLFILGGFALAVICFYAEEDLRGWYAWQTFKQQAEAAGEKLDYASVVPPAVPDDQNFAMAPIVASSYAAKLDRNGRLISPPLTNVVDRLDMTIYRDSDWAQQPTNGYWPMATFTSLKEWQMYFSTPPTNSLTNEFPVPHQPQSAAADVLFGLGKFDSDIEELRQASRLPQSRFPINYDVKIPFDALLPHLSSLKRCSQTLQLRALAELEMGQPDKALDDIKLGMRLIDSTRSEPFLISHLVRMAQFSITLQPVYEGLAKHKWSATQLVELETELAKLNFLEDCQLAMRGERNASLTTIDYLRRSKDYSDIITMLSVDVMFNGDEEDGIKWNLILGSTVLQLTPTGWFWMNKALIGRVYQQWYLRICDPEKHLATPSIANQAEHGIDAELFPKRPWNMLAALVLGSLTAGERKCAFAQCSADMAMIACALERYRLANGNYPDSLEKLFPQFIGEIPHDVINGQPLKYHRTEDGRFLLYSVGWNEVDDGGKVGFKQSGLYDIKTGDWVWEYPRH